MNYKHGGTYRRKVQILFYCSKMYLLIQSKADTCDNEMFPVRVPIKKNYKHGGKYNQRCKGQKKKNHNLQQNVSHSKQDCNSV